MVSILKNYAAKKLSTAFVRKFREKKYTPDDLETLTEISKGRNIQKEFRKSVWFKLKLGSKQKVEKQQILNKLNNIGKISKKDVGIIKIERDISFIEINSRVLDKVLNSIDNNKKYPELDLILLKNKPNISMDKRSNFIPNQFKKRRKNKRKNSYIK